MRLSAYPYVEVRMRCDTCKRVGKYRLARLAAKYGAETDLWMILIRLTADCPWRNDHPKKNSQDSCGEFLPDLIGPPRPPDMPPIPGKLTIITGGKDAPPAAISKRLRTLP